MRIKQTWPSAALLLTSAGPVLATLPAATATESIALRQARLPRTHCPRQSAIMLCLNRDPGRRRRIKPGARPVMSWISGSVLIWQAGQIGFCTMRGRPSKALPERTGPTRPVRLLVRRCRCRESHSLERLDRTQGGRKQAAGCPLFCMQMG